MRIILITLVLLLGAYYCFAAPNNSISIPNDFVPNTTALSSEVDANFNEVSGKYNAHTHADLTGLGTVTTGVWQATAIDYAYLSFSNNIVAGDIAEGAVGASELAVTAVTAGSYTATDLTVDADGRITAASNGTIDLTSEVSGALPSANGGSAIAGKQINVFTYTGNNGSAKTVAHGLGSTPDSLFIWDIDGSTPAAWMDGQGTTGKVLSSGADLANMLGASEVDGTNIYIGTAGAVNTGTRTYYVTAICENE